MTCQANSKGENHSLTYNKADTKIDPKTATIFNPNSKYKTSIVISPKILIKMKDGANM